jgi:NhaP-type Na+/H+ or K+/H+ antiporter
MITAGLVTALVAYLLTDSIGWAIVGLFGAGVVLNALAQGWNSAFESRQRASER